MRVLVAAVGVLGVLGATSLLACGCSSTKTNAGFVALTPDSSVSIPDAGGAGDSSDDGSGGPILSIGDGGASPDVASACKKLNIGIFGNPGSNPSSNFQSWLVASGTSVQRVQTDPNDPLTAAVLMPFDAVVLDHLVRTYSTDEAAIFSAWVAAGGGTATMTGYSNDATDFRANGLLAPLGVAYGGALLSGPVTEFVPHPITLGLTSVTFEGGYLISDLGGTASTRTSIAQLSSGSASFAIQMGSGRAFVWGDEWIEYDSEWSVMPEIKQLWVNVFQWLAPPDRCLLQPPH